MSLRLIKSGGHLFQDKNNKILTLRLEHINEIHSEYESGDKPCSGLHRRMSTIFMPVTLANIYCKKNDNSE
jgi:hypothetical protein